jgi:hypothetical protein
LNDDCTARQLALAKGKSAPEAARAAGYEGTSLVSNATKRAASPRVRERVAALQAKLAEEIAMTSSILIDRAEQARLMAMRLEKPGEAIRAIETIAKLYGLWKEKPGAQNQFNGPVTFEVHYTRESISVSATQPQHADKQLEITPT